MLPQENLAPDKTLPTFCQNANDFNKVTVHGGWPFCRPVSLQLDLPLFLGGPGSLALSLGQDKDKWVN